MSGMVTKELQEMEEAAKALFRQAAAEEGV